MYILAGKKVFRSDEEPVMILFSAQELRDIKAQTDENQDIWCFAPPSWGDDIRSQWLERHKGRLVLALNRDGKKSFAKKPIPMKPPIQIISDDAIAKMVKTKGVTVEETGEGEWNES